MLSALGGCHWPPNTIMKKGRAGTTAKVNPGAWLTSDPRGCCSNEQQEVIGGGLSLPDSVKLVPPRCRCRPDENEEGPPSAAGRPGGRPRRGYQP